MIRMTRAGAVAALITGGLGLAVSVVPASADSAATVKFPASAVEAPWVALQGGHGRNSAKAALGLCRTAAELGLPFSYAVPSAGEVNAIVDDPINDSGLSNLGCTTPQNETTIAVNPVNPLNVISGSNDYRVCCDLDGLNDGTGWAYYSFDGGHTWGNVQVPGLTAQTGGQGVFSKLDSAGDPVMAFGPDGTAYYANIVFSRVSPASGIAVSTSPDGGATWSAPNMVAFSSSANFFHDKEWIAAGPNGKVVVTWTRFNLGAQGLGYVESPIVGAISSDSGKTWNRQGFPVSDAARPYNQGSQVAFAPNGDLYVAYEATSPSAGYTTDAVALARSRNDGRTFETVELARVYDDLDCYPVFNGRQTLTGLNFRLNSYPSMSIDPTTGRIAVAWADNEGSGTCGQGGTQFSGTTSNQVKLVTGTWGSFGTVQRITPQGSADTVFPSVAAADGTVVVSYYTRGYPSTNPACFLAIPQNVPQAIPAYETRTDSVCLDYAARSSSDGFTAERRLTSEGSNPFVQFANGAFIGDYTHIAIGTDGTAHASWTDFRGRPGTNTPNQDVYVSSFPA